ncbi:MAG: hypothetical protein Q9181_004475 [Wetmoreana brouardii]
MLTTFLLLSTFIIRCASRSPQCDSHTRAPRNPSVGDCQSFLRSLSIKAQEPGTIYKWFGRNIEPCDQCVQLPTIIQYGRFKCAALIDVDDEHETDVAIFDLGDVHQALLDLINVCWLAKGFNGRGYPGGQVVWAAFVEGIHPKLGIVGNGMKEMETWTNRTVSILNLEYT